MQQFFFQIDGFREEHKRLLNKNFRFRWLQKKLFDQNLIIQAECLDFSSSGQKNIWNGDTFNFEGDCILKESEELYFCQTSSSSCKNFIFIDIIFIKGLFYERTLETSTMSLKLSEKNRIKVVDLISYLVTSGKIIFRKDSYFDISEIKTNFYRFFTALVRLWPEGSDVRDRTPNISVNSDIDRVC